METGRGSLPFALLHGESLVGCATWALGEAGVESVGLTASWPVQGRHAAYVVHDSLCPMTPPTFLAGCVDASLAREAVVVGVRPVTDTVKALRGELLGETLDRDGLVVVASPVVLPATVVAALNGLPSADFAELVGELRRRWPVLFVEAPPEGRRVSSEADLALLAALTAPA